MKIRQLNAYIVKLPFKGEFSISKLKRLFSQTVVVELICDNGKLMGYGEGLPVKFVTGETPDTVIQAIESFVHHDLFPSNLHGPQQIWNFIDSLPQEKSNNAAICSLEIALLDLLARGEGKSILEYFPEKFLVNKIYYSATVTLGKKGRVMELCEGIKALGIRQVRVKMDRDFHQNQKMLTLTRKILGNDCQLRVDPNGVWDKNLAFKHLPLIKEMNVEIVEEPMPRDAEGFEEFAIALRKEGIHLMACESAPTIQDVKAIAAEPYYTVINVKLSRSGGFRRSLGIIDFIRSNQLSFQIGCTIGESGILSAAGRAFGLLCGDALCYDGSYDNYVLQENITTENVSFGFRGEAGPLPSNGLGIEVDRRRLEALSERVISITFQKTY